MCSTDAHGTIIGILGMDMRDFVKLSCQDHDYLQKKSTLLARTNEVGKLQGCKDETTLEHPEKAWNIQKRQPCKILEDDVSSSASILKAGSNAYDMFSCMNVP